MKLPGIKVEHNEVPAEALDRLMADQMHSMKVCVEITDKRVSHVLKDSKSFAVQTKYVRSEFIAKFHSDKEFPIRVMEVNYDKMTEDVGVASACSDPSQKMRTSCLDRLLWRRVGGIARSATTNIGAMMTDKAVARDPDVHPFMVGAESGKTKEVVWAWLPPEWVDNEELHMAKEESFRQWVPYLCPVRSTSSQHLRGEFKTGELSFEAM
jgi:hypothetical protein